MSEEGSNGWWRRNVDRRLEHLEQQNVAVLATRLQYIEAELHDIRRTLTWAMRTVLGMGVTIFAGVLVYVLSQGLGPR